MVNTEPNNVSNKTPTKWEPKFKEGDCISWNNKKLTISKYEIKGDNGIYTFDNGLIFDGTSIDNGRGPPHNVEAAIKINCIEKPNISGGKRKTRNNLKNKKTKKYRKSNRRHRRY